MTPGWQEKYRQSLDKLDTQIIECKRWRMVAERLEGVWAIGDEVGVELTLIRWPPILTAHVPTTPLTPTMAMASSQQPKQHDVVLPTLDVFIQILSIAKDVCGIPPAQVALGAASTLLTMIRVWFPYYAKTIL